MTADYLKDILFDLINESDALNVKDVRWDGAAQALRIKAEDGGEFFVRVEAI